MPARQFDLFRNQPPGDGPQASRRLPDWPPPPDWRSFLPEETLPQHLSDADDRKRWEALDFLAEARPRQQRSGEVFRLPATEEGERVRLAVNAALHLRRPLLVSGDPGSGKTSLAYAIAWELGLGPVLTWPITPRTRLREDGLYRYDALSRLQDTQLDQIVGGSPRRTGTHAHRGGNGQKRPIGDYITLGPVGTAFLPSRWPRVLLIDEIDKSDLQLPSELLHLFEEGEYEIEELLRDAGDAPNMVRTADRGLLVPLSSGSVQCHVFPLVVMTSNNEREFPAAFHRRCIRVEMPRPTTESLLPLLKAHFPSVEGDVTTWIDEFIGPDNQGDRAVDQLLNAVFLLTQPSDSRPTEEQMKALKEVLYKHLSER
jgi:MoxR-like ATPase